MKKKISFVFSLALLSFFWMSCTKDLGGKKGQPVADSVKIASLLQSATVSTIISDNFANFTVDKFGNMYGLKYNTNTIYKISATGQETVFYTPPAPTQQDTSTNTLTCLATDSSANVYTVNLNNFSHIERVLKITPTGTASTFLDNVNQYLGTPNYYIYQIAIDKNGNTYLGDNSGIYKVTPDDKGSTVTTQQYGNCFAVDKNGNVICPMNGITKISPTGTVTSLTPDYGSASIVSTDVFGDVFIGINTGSGNAIYLIDPLGKVHTLLSSSTSSHVDGPIAIAKIAAPFHMGSDATGNFYFYETGDGINDIRKVTF